MAINPAKLLPPSGGALAVRSKTIDIGKKKEVGVEGQVLIIKTQVIKIEKLITRGYTLKLKEQKEEQKENETKKRAKREEELEEKKAPKEGKGKIPALPKLGFLDRIRKFIGNMLLAYFAVRLIDHLPKLVPFAYAVGYAAEFLLDVGGNLLNGLVTFVDWGYKAYDATRGFLKNLGGENFAKVFDGFNGALGTLIETAIVAAVTLSSFGGDSDVSPGAPKKGFDTKGRRVSANVQKRYAQRFGKDQFLKRFGQRNVINLGEKGASKSILKFTKPFLKRLPIIGALIDFGLSVALGEDPGRAAFKAIGAGIFGSIGAAIGSLAFGFGGIVGGILGSIGGDAIGGALYDVFFGNKKPQPKKQKVQGKAGGGITRGGKKQGAIRRTGGVTGKGKIKRKTRLAQKPREVEFKSPGADIGGEEKLFGIFPNPLKAAQKAIDTVNPFKAIENTGKNLGKSDYFGPILAITSKITLGQKPTQQDYKNVGLGINLLFNEGMNKGQLVGGVAAAYAEGGFVDKKTLDAISESGDISDWVAKSFKDATETNAQKTLREIRENAKKKKEGEDSDAATGPRGSGEPEGLETAGGAVAASELYKEIGANAEQWDIFRNSIALIESGGKYGVPGGSGKHYDGRYQMGKAAKTDGSRVAGVPNPGHSDDPNAHVRVSFRNNPQLQETIFTGFTIANHRYLMRNPKYKSASVERKLEILGYAHNQGMGGAENWLNTGKVGADGFGTKGTKYTDLIAKNFRAKKSGGKMELAQGAVDISKEEVGPTSSTLKGKHGLLSLGGTNAPGGDRTLSSSSTFSNTHLHHNKPDSDSYNQREFGKPRDYVITRGDQSKDKGAPVPAGVSGVARAIGGTYGSVEIFDNSGKKLSRFLHNDTIKIKDGQKVSPNTIIATQGNKGTVPVHVHLETSPANHTRWIQGITKSAFLGENFGIVPKDGFTLRLHKGEMYKVIDKDSVDLLGFDLTKEIIDIENRSQLIAKAPSIIEKLKAISGYASYESEAQQTVIIQDTPEQDSYQDPMVAVIGGGSGGGDSYDPFAMLDRLSG